MGGYHVTLIPEEAAQHADAIVVGDAEPVWQRLLDDARHGRLAAPTTARSPTGWPDCVRGATCFAGRTTSAWRSWSRLAVAATTATSAPSRPSTKPASTGVRRATWLRKWRPADAAGSSSSTIISVRIPSGPRNSARNSVPLHIRWVGQVDLRAARNDRLLERLVASGCRGVLVGIESLDSQNLAG